MPWWQYAAVHPDKTTVLRAATADDALCIAVLGGQVFLDTYATQGLRPVLAREVRQHFDPHLMARLLAQPEQRFVVAECQGHLVGFVQLALGARQPLVQATVSAEVERLYVLRRFAGRGLGTRLLEHAAGIAAEHCATHLWLSAWVGNTRALAYYAKLGWLDVGATDYVFEGQAFVNRVFVRRLT